MHPTLARFLNLDVAADALYRDQLGQVLKADEKPYVELARQAPDQRAAILASRRAPHPSDEAQQALLFLAAHAAVGAVREDGTLGPLVQSAEKSLKDEGASKEEVDSFLASLLLEEAFGYDEGADHFDHSFLEETLQLVPELARLTRERVEALIESFTRSADEGWRRAHHVAANALIEIAWEDGPEPINPEHVENALEVAGRRLGKAESAKAAEATRRFVEWLEKQRLVGAQRRTYLIEAINRSSGGAPTANTPLN
ncbi:MAG: hypothetical protein ACT4TC_18075 [Myxococcaceae bacterium]